MGKVLLFKGRGDARSDAGREMIATSHEKGAIRFVVNDTGDTDMHVTGIFEKSLQFAGFTALKGAVRIFDTIVKCGGSGQFSAGPLHEQLMQGTKRKKPKRLREWTSFSNLE
jgi:hypothetical protein